MVRPLLNIRATASRAENSCKAQRSPSAQDPHSGRQASWPNRPRSDDAHVQVPGDVSARVLVLVGPFRAVLRCGGQSVVTMDDPTVGDAESEPFPKTNYTEGLRCEQGVRMGG